MASVEPGRERRDLAQRGRDRVPGEVHADAGGGHDRRPVGIEARGRQPLPPGVARLEVDRHEPQPRRDAEAELDQALALPGLRTGLVDLEDPQAGGELRPALGEGVQAGAEDDVLADAAASLLHDQILDEASTGHDGGAEGPCATGPCPDGCASRRPGPPARRPISSSSTCGGGSTWTCMARHKATRTAVLSGAAFGFSGMAFLSAPNLDFFTFTMPSTVHVPQPKKVVVAKALDSGTGSN